MQMKAGLAGKLLAGADQQVADGTVGQGADLGRHAFRIAFEPWLFRQAGGKCRQRLRQSLGRARCRLRRGLCRSRLGRRRCLGVADLAVFAAAACASPPALRLPSPARLAAFGLACAAALAAGAFALSAPPAGFEAALAFAFSGAVVFAAFATCCLPRSVPCAAPLLNDRNVLRCSRCGFPRNPACRLCIATIGEPCKSCPCGRTGKICRRNLSALTLSSPCLLSAPAAMRSLWFIVFATSAINKKMQSLTIL